MKESSLGLELKYGPCRIFFGGRDSQILNLKKQEPQLQFIRLRQIHSADVVVVNKETPDYQLPGDALITSDSNLALCSITGDCVPILIFCPTTRRVAAVHAGWKGVASRILPVTLQKMNESGSSFENLRLWIGPHILQSSFEVETDVATTILASIHLTLDSAPEIALAKENGRFDFSLLQVLIEQVAALNVPLENVEMELRDTKTDLAYHSARRDGQLSGRQISWICLSEAI
jgi:YfiH family protein